MEDGAKISRKRNRPSIFVEVRRKVLFRKQSNKTKRPFDAAQQDMVGVIHSFPD
jgi:hypothetical protein